MEHIHPNRLPFRGVLTRVDEPSDRAPYGAKGHRVILAREAAEDAIPSLIGMAVGYKRWWHGHDVRQKIGVISEAELIGRNLVVGGFIFAKDFPEVRRKVLRAGDALGMSYELADARIEDMGAEFWRVTQTFFSGAAILMRNRAAYSQTSFVLAERARPLRMAAMAGMEIRGVAE